MVELLGTLALTAVLMLAVLSVVASAARARADLASRQRREIWSDGLPAILRRDVAQASDVEAAGGVLTLTTYGLLDPAAGEPLSRPGRVIYRIQTIRGTPWLVREQSAPFGAEAPAPSAPGAGRRWTELVCSDVAGLVLDQPQGGRALRLELRSTRPGVAPVDGEFWRE